MRTTGWGHGLLLGTALCTLGSAAQGQDVAPVSASSVYEPGYLAEYAADGDSATRWASGSLDAPQSLVVDLGQSVAITSLTLNWETAHAVDYAIEASDDGQTWQTLREIRDCPGGVQTHAGLDGRGRYLRILCTRATTYRIYSIWEVSSDDPALAGALADVARRVIADRENRAKEVRERLARTVEELGWREIVFAVRQPGVDGHWYANFGYYAADPAQKLYRPGGKLCKLDMTTGEVTALIDDPAGCVRDPQVSYDGQRILFSYMPAGTENYHLYEINADGAGLRQLTEGDCDDIEPIYLPDGGIMFCSSRCYRWVNCWLTPVAILYRCDADGGNVRVVSSNVEHDNTPWVMPDGRVLYMRWEYVDRSQVDYHHLWTARPDGTEQMVFYGNLHPGIAMLDAKPIPGTRKVATVWSPGHGALEHQGPIAVIDPGDGPDDLAMTQVVSGGSDFHDPYPVGDAGFLVARGAAIQLLDPSGTTQPVYQLPAEDAARGFWCHEPRPLVPRPREPVLPSGIREGEPTGRLVLADIYRGRNMAGVRRGEIKKLLVLESLPKPINYTGGMDPLTYGGTFTLERVVGTVPVEPDGSAYMELPALRSLFLVALDENNLSVKRMQSFLTVQPGETTSCVGCHEQRTETAAVTGVLQATQRPPSPIEPIPGIPDVFDFPRDIQPILDRHCVRCHDYDASEGGEGPMSGGLILTGDHGPMFSHSYYMLTIRGQIADGRNRPQSNYPPRALGTSASPLMQKILSGNYGLTQEETDMVRYWIESGAAYPGTYGALGGGSIGGYYANQLVETDWDWPETQRAGEAIKRRCASCHVDATCLPVNLSDERDVSFWRPEWTDARLRNARHIVFNLSRPEKSLMLLAPLSKQAGGYEMCRTDAGPVFADRDDADYQAILAMCEAGKRRLEEMKRFDMPGFRPPQPYLRELARTGVLPGIPPADAPVDCYALDQAYWRSQWYPPSS